jgi:hypothetical protein
MKARARRSLLSIAVLTAILMVAPPASAGAACPTPVPCTTGGPTCWAVNVKYHSNQTVGGVPDYATYNVWVPGMAFELRTDAECAAGELAIKGVWLPAWFPQQLPGEDVGGYLVPPARLDAVTITDLYGVTVDAGFAR